MKTEFQTGLEKVTQNAVISLGEDHGSYKISDLISIINRILGAWDRGHNYIINFRDVFILKLSNNKINFPLQALDQGCDCEILDAQFKEWKKGKLKVKLVLEFIPDDPEVNDPESPLDEIRREISQLKQES